MWRRKNGKERDGGKSGKERSTKELFETQEQSHSIDLSPGLQTMCAELPLDPYLLGSCLADGYSKGGCIWGNIQDLIESVPSFTKPASETTRPDKHRGNTPNVQTPPTP